MPGRTNTYLLLLIPFLLAVGIPLHAQQEWQISPTAPLSYPLPAGSEFQSAGVIGTTTLVAWGTTRKLGSDTVVPTIAMQILHGTTPLGTAEFLADTNARPSGTISVVPLDSIFLLLWVDKRLGDPGIYLQRYRIDGSPTGTSHLIAPGGEIAGDNSVWLLHDNTRYSIEWKRSMGNTGDFYFRLPVTSDGTPGALRQLPIINYDNDIDLLELPNARIVVDSVSNAATFIHADGRPDTRSIAATLFRLPFYIGADSGMISLVDNAGVKELLYRRSIFDSSVTKRIRIPVPGNSIRTIGAIGKDTAGNVQVVIAETYGKGSPNTFITITGRIYRIGLEKDSVRRMDTIWLRGVGNFFDGPADNKVYFSLDGLQFLPGDYGTCRLLFTTTTTEIIGMPPETTASVDKWIIDLDASGAIQRPVSIDSLTTLQSKRTLLSISSINADSVTILRALVAGIPDTLRATGPVGIPSYSHRQPSIFLRNGKLLATWEQTSLPISYALGLIETAQLNNAHVLNTFVPDPTIPYLTQSNSRTWHANSITPRTTPNLSIITLSITEGFIDRGGGKRDEIFQDFAATDTGWAPLSSQSNEIFLVSPYLLPQQPDQASYHYDPDRGTIFSSYVGLTGTRRVAEYGLRGNALYADSNHLPYHDTVSAMLPIADHKIISISGSVLRQFSSQSLMGTESLANDELDNGNAAYYRVLGSGVLEIARDTAAHMLDSLHQHSSLMLYNVSTKTTAFAKTVIPWYPDPPTFAQQHSSRDIAFLWGSNRGVHLALYSDALHTIIADSIIASRNRSALSPRGVFRGDSLYIVWTEPRPTGSEIMGTIWTLPQQYRRIDSSNVEIGNPVDSSTTGGGEHDSTGTGSHDSTTPSMRNPIFFAVTPLPADASVSITFSTIDISPVEFEVVDALGRSIRRWAIFISINGKQTFPFNVQWLHTGAYILRMRSGSSVATTRFVVLH